MSGLIAAGLVGVAATSASAAVLVESAPVGDVGTNFMNNSATYSYLMQFTLDSAATISEFDIYTWEGFATLGKDVTVRVRADAGGAPAAANLYEFGSTLTNVSVLDDVTLAGTSFAPITLAAGTYWFGVSGTNSELGWTSFTGNTGPAYLLLGDTLQFSTRSHSAFRVIGDAAGAVPEPANWAMMVGGFALAGAAMRRRQRAAIRFA